MEAISKQRIVTFSDGVFTIMITLLILPIHEHLPNLSSAALGKEFTAFIPYLLSFVMSFIIIGIYWLNHHQLFNAMKYVNMKIIWLNMFHLLFVSFLSVSTALVGQYSLTSIAAILYGANLILANLSCFLIIRIMQHDLSLINEKIDRKIFKTFNLFYPLIAITYLIPILLSFVQPLISYIIYFSINIAAIISSFRSQIYISNNTP